MIKIKNYSTVNIPNTIAKKIRVKKEYFKNLYLINLKALVIISYDIKDT